MCVGVYGFRVNTCASIHLLLCSLMRCVADGNFATRDTSRSNLPDPFRVKQERKFIGSEGDYFCRIRRSQYLTLASNAHCFARVTTKKTGKHSSIDEDEFFFVVCLSDGDVHHFLCCRRYLKPPTP